MKSLFIVLTCMSLTGCFFIDNLKCSFRNDCKSSYEYVEPEIRVRLGVLNSLPSGKNISIELVAEKDIEIVRVTPFVQKSLKQNGFSVSRTKQNYVGLYSLEHLESLRQVPRYGSTGVSSIMPNSYGGYNVTQGYGVIGYETVADYDTCFYFSIVKRDLGEIYSSYLCFETVPYHYKKFTYDYIGEIYQRFMMMGDGTEEFLCSKKKNSRGNYCEKEEQFYDYSQKAEE